jgi:O-antigen ligase
VISNDHRSRFRPPSTVARIREIARAIATRSARFGAFGPALRDWRAAVAADPLRVGVIAATFVLVGTMLFQRPIGGVAVGGAELDVRPWDVAWVGFIFFALPLTIRHLRAEGLRALRPPTKAAAVFALYAAAAALSLLAFFHEFGSAGFPEAVIRAARFALVAYAGLVLARELGPRAQTALIVAVVGVSIIAGAEALYAYAFDIKQEIIGSRIVEFRVTRPGGPFGNYRSDGLPDRWWASPGASTTLGFWLCVAIALAGAAILRRSPTLDRPAMRMLALLSMPPLVAALAVTRSREAWIGGLVVLVFLLVLYWRVRKIPALVLVVGAIGSVALAVAISPRVSNRLVDTFTPGTFEFRTGPQARLHAWHEGLAIAWDRFPIGWGIGAVEEHSQLFGTTTSENLYIQSLVQMGVVGALLIVAFVVYGLWEPIRELCLDSTGLWSVLRFSVFAVAATQGVFGYTLADPTVQVLVALALVPPVSRTQSDMDSVIFRKKP